MPRGYLTDTVPLALAWLKYYSRPIGARYEQTIPWPADRSCGGLLHVIRGYVLAAFDRFRNCGDHESHWVHERVRVHFRGVDVFLGAWLRVRCPRIKLVAPRVPAGRRCLPGSGEFALLGSRPGWVRHGFSRVPSGAHELSCKADCFSGAFGRRGCGARPTSNDVSEVNSWARRARLLLAEFLLTSVCTLFRLSLRS